MSSVSAQRPVRVLHLGSSTGLYGAERWILALVRNLPAGQVDSHVAAIKDAPGEGPALCEQAAQFGVRTAVFEAHGKISWPAVGQIRQYIRTHAIDVLHTHGYKTDLIGLLAVRGTECRIVSTPHGWSANAGLKVQLYEWLDRMAFPFLDAVAPLSPELHEGLKRIPRLKHKLHLIRNGVDLSEIDTTNAPAPELEAWRAQGAFIVGYIGQLIPRKGVDVLIRAFSQLELPGKRLCLIGEGPQRAELEQLAASVCAPGEVHFLGYRTDRIALLKRFDVFVLASALEGIPRCLLESLAAQVPVIATDIPGCRDLVEHERTGWLVPVGDVGSLARTLARAAANAEERAALASAGEAKVRAEFSAERMAREYTALYQAVLTGRDGQPAAQTRDCGVP